MLPELEQGDSLKHRLLEKWAENSHFFDPRDTQTLPGSQTFESIKPDHQSDQLIDNFQRFFNTAMSKNSEELGLRPEMPQYVFDSQTFEMKIRKAKTG